MRIKNDNTVVFKDTDNGGIIHVANIKGGVGKSTVATNLAAALSERGPTLVIDLDVQGSATCALGMDPLEFKLSSWNLFDSRFSLKDSEKDIEKGTWSKILYYIRKGESTFFPQIVGRDELTSLAINIKPNLDLIPATSDLFNNMNLFHLQNLLFNLQLCRNYYKYIILDTPSVWNRLTRYLFLHSDLNLIPVTLNALSTRSLRDYMSNIKRIARKNPGVRIRIIKNEVFGRKESTVKGKTRTMNENREFLENLCEQVAIYNNTGISLVPQSIIFDLEIPESATVRDAQDIGISVHDYQQYSSTAKAFIELSKRVQYVLNNSAVGISKSKSVVNQARLTFAAKAFAILILFIMVTFNEPISSFCVPRPLAPQQITATDEQVIEFEFTGNESLLKIAKYAICHLKAVVPRSYQVREYMEETIRVHNLTRMSGEKKITNYMSIPEGTVIKFYPSLKINNPKEKRLIPVYRYFTELTDDPYSYITGDWCERGTGGGIPHYGIDVAANIGSEIISPIDGIAQLHNSSSAGRMLGVVRDGRVVFFAHMAKRYFNSGEDVKKGDALGTVGMTGITSGPHVHVGYGLETPSKKAGIVFGHRYYKVTDPKLFFYSEQYIKSLQ